MNTQPRPTTIPENATRVYKGELFEVYQWPETMFDGSTKTFEKVRRQDTVVIIPVTDDKKVLVAMQEQPTKPPFLGFISGRMDDGEEPLQAAKRELLEETGYASEDWELYQTEQPVHKLDWNIYTFVARGCKKVAEQNLDAGEKIRPQVLTYEELTRSAIDGSLHDIELGNTLMRSKLDPDFGTKLQVLLFGNSGL